jgi:hypothetical protein
MWILQEEGPPQTVRIRQVEDGLILEPVETAAVLSLERL